MTASMFATVLLAFGASCLFVWALMPVARRIGLVDIPGGRKTHDGEVPTIGGLAIVAAVNVTVFLLGTADEVHIAFWVGLMVIVLIGTLDDLRDLGHHSKFLAQIAAAGLMLFWGGWHLHSLGNLVGAWPLGLGVYAIPITFMAIVGVINAVNFTDGADGLAGGLVFNALFWFCAMGLSAPSGEMQIALAFLGAVAGFLMFNLRLPGRSRALAFLGDAGSLGLGYVLAWFMVTGAERSVPLFAPVTAIWLLAVPLVDTLACSGRRLLNGNSPFKADRKHLHHILADLGLPVQKAVALIHACSFLLGGIGVAGWYWGVAEHVMFYVSMAIFAAYLVFSSLALQAIDARRQQTN
jgi:UDP-GlcNAc:undecaprenyl-phosphate GlcNAc-1-phosphate transferase